MNLSGISIISDADTNSIRVSKLRDSVGCSEHVVLSYVLQNIDRTLHNLLKVDLEPTDNVVTSYLQASGACTTKYKITAGDIRYARLKEYENIELAFDIRIRAAFTSILSLVVYNNNYYSNKVVPHVTIDTVSRIIKAGSADNQLLDIAVVESFIRDNEFQYVQSIAGMSDEETSSARWKHNDTYRSLTKHSGFVAMIKMLQTKINGTKNDLRFVAKVISMLHTEVHESSIDSEFITTIGIAQVTDQDKYTASDLLLNTNKLSDWKSGVVWQLRETDPDLFTLSMDLTAIEILGIFNAAEVVRSKLDIDSTPLCEVEY